MSDFSLFLKKYKWQSFWIIISSVLINILALSTALYVIQVFNRFLTYKLDSTLIVLTVGVLLAFFMEFLLRILRGLLVNKVTMIGIREYSSEKIKKLLSFKLGQKNIKISDTNILRSLDPNLNLQYLNSADKLVAFIDIFFSLLFIVVISLLSLKLGLISMIMAGTLILFTKLKYSIYNIYSKKRTLLINKTNDIINDIQNLAITIRYFNAAKILEEKFKLQHARQRIYEKKYKDTINIFNTFSIMFPIMGTILIIFFGAKEVSENLITIGALIGINVLNSRVYSPIFRLGDSNKTSQTFNEKYFKNLETIENENIKGLSPKIMKGNIMIRDLSIGFNNSKDTLFQRFNCNIPSGSLVVINGYNSSGKTSLCQALMGIIKPTRGNIMFDNIDLEKINISWLRSQICYLPQDIELFNLTLKENILINNSYNKDKSNFREENREGLLSKIILMVGLNDYINSLKSGIDEKIKNNGKHLPVGIKKRIGLARALVNSGQVVIFDEPTESLDKLGITKLFSILNDFRKLRKTIIIASHDPNIIKSAGIIIDLSIKPIPRIGVRKKINK